MMIQSKPGMLIVSGRAVTLAWHSLWLRLAGTCQRQLCPGPLLTPTTTHSWTPPRYILSMSEERHERVRKKYHILVEGDGIPPPIKSFKEMKFPAGTWGVGVASHLVVKCL